MKRIFDKNKIEFILFLLGIIGIIIFKLTDNKDNKTISKNQGYAIGTLNDFYKGKSYVSWVPNVIQLTSESSKVKFNYLVDTIEYRVNYSTDTYPINENLAIVGKKYLVVYNQNKRTKARILLEYPILDSSDFKRMVREFKIDPNRYILK
jgi:hypothetical protein